MTALRIFQAWRAGFTRRWHTNADLSGTDDFNHGHQGRVALLVMMLKPDVSRSALIQAISHDLGEHKYGDLPYDLKQEDPDLAKRSAELEAAEIARLGISSDPISERENDLLKLCDWLDAYLWMAKHQPQLMRRSDWAQQRARMLAMAKHLDVEAEAKGLLHLACRASVIAE